MPLSFELAEEYFFYDPFSAKIFWIKSRGSNAQLWQEAGSVGGSGYRHIRIFGKIYQASNIIWLLMTGEWPPRQIDHINRNRSDDRWENLRLATGSQNLHNQNLKPSNTSGYRGVSWDKKHQRWKSSIRYPGGTHHHSRRFKNKIEAARHYDKMARQIYGEFANVNFP